MFQEFRVSAMEAAEKIQIVFIFRPGFFRLIFSAVPVLNRQVRLSGVPAKVGAGHRRNAWRAMRLRWENQTVDSKEELLHAVVWAQTPEHVLSISSIYYHLLHTPSFLAARIRDGRTFLKVYLLSVVQNCKHTTFYVQPGLRCKMMQVWMENIETTNINQHSWLARAECKFSQ